MTNLTSRKLRVGFDLDGVLLVNPLMAVRPLLKYIRKNILKKSSTGSYTPKTKIETFINYFYVKISYFKMRGFNDIIKLIDAGKIEAYIITSRHSAYEKEFRNSVARLNTGGHFTQSIFNKNDEEPYIFKEKTIKALNLDFFVEDNYDVVCKLNERFPNKIFWITNIVDSHLAFKHKFYDLRGIAKRLLFAIGL